MALNAESKIVNLERSLFRLVYDTLEVGKSLAGLISYDDDLFDTTGKDKWVRVTMLDVGTRRGSFQQCQITCATRVLDTDSQGLTLKQLVDDVRDALNVNSFTMYDYSVDVDNPSIVYDDSGSAVLVALRLIGPNVQQPIVEGARAQILTYGIWLWRDDMVQ